MRDPSATSLSLLQRIRNGDESGWRRVVDLYAPLVEHWCRRWGVKGADVDDLVQEVFQAAAQSIEGFRRDRAGDTFRGWLRAITRHKVMTFWRTHGQQPEVFGGSEAQQRLQEVPDSEPVDDPADAEQVSAVFHRALGLLHSEFEQRTWQAFWRITVDGLSAVDVAAELGMTASAVRMAKSRVLRRLREELGDLVG
jgi:RNA polymerase sigma-70 factor (ECF subfamily)